MKTSVSLEQSNDSFVCFFGFYTSVTTPVNIDFVETSLSVAFCINIQFAVEDIWLYCMLASMRN